MPDGAMRLCAWYAIPGTDIAINLRTCYAIFGTDAVYGVSSGGTERAFADVRFRCAISLRLSGTAIACGAIDLRACYAKSSTEGGDGATAMTGRCLRRLGLLRVSPLCPYA
eukprot:796968-Rhodomonas_salina.1